MGRGRSLLWSSIAAVCSVLLLLAITKPLPHLPTSDIYTHLSVTRHLAQGEGFLTDITYPLSFAYPFARELPQPLIHRQPGYAMLLQIPYATAGGDAHQTLTHIRTMQFFILGLIIVAGSMGYLRRGKGQALLPWLVFLLANPLLGFALDWGFVELVCGLILLVIWLRGRDVQEDGAGPLDGLLVGILALLRFDLFWVPWFWFLWWRTDHYKKSPGIPFFNGRILGAMVMFVLMLAPWAVRNIQLSGQPFFSLQAQAELVKMTPAWPDYSVYKQLEPQPLLQTIQEQPAAVINKVKHGMWFFLKEHHKFMPWILFWAGAAPAILYGFVLLMKGLLFFVFRKPFPVPGINPEDHSAGPNIVAFFTLAMLCLQYSFFDHDLRHLIVLLPILLWETTRMIGDMAGQIARRNTASWHKKVNPLRTGFTGIVLAIFLVFLWPCQLPGWQNAAKEAKARQAAVAQRVAWVQANPETVLFEGTSAVPWFANQPAVWTPADEDIRNKIREMLSQ